MNAWQLLKFQVALYWQNPFVGVSPLLFFSLVLLMFPLALGALPQTLASLAPGLVWVAALLASFLSLSNLFAEDLADGSIELITLSEAGLLSYSWIKLLVHWVFYLLPLVLIAPVFGLALGLPLIAVPVLLVSLTLGSFVLVALGAIAVALVGNKNAFLLAVIVLPWYVPVLIFGAAGVEAASLGLSAAGSLYFLLGLSLLVSITAPWVIAKGLSWSLAS